ncbi:hypothetical protein [Ornithinibacillus scapharcae]|uniref:hypothetical protein n=1 Tax=Ornithinibacillus scapharcae TaxID=1147159 RepID=UPI000225AACD|nr:hypothetical protein [Ornithinibacillus scapharcae]
MTNQENQDIEHIIKKFELKIKKSTKYTHYQDQEDLEQEIKLKIIEKLTTTEFEEPPGFWSFLTEQSKIKY